MTRTILLASCLVAAGCEVNLNTEGLSSTETRTFTVTGPPDLTLDTFDGAIEIHSWDRQTIEVSIEKRAMEQALLDEMTVEAEQQGNRIAVRVKGPSRRQGGLTVGVHISPQARLLVTVPRQLTLQAQTGDGAVTAEDLEGRLTLKTADGRVRGDRLSGELEVRTSDGPITLEGVSGRLDLETSDGRITLDGRPAALRVRTGDGAIRVRVDAGTTMSEDWDLSTSDGSVTLALPSAFAADIDAETSDGAVRATHPGITASPDSDDRDGDDRERRRTLRTRMGEGGRVLKIRSGDGTIRIES